MRSAWQSAPLYFGGLSWRGALCAVAPTGYDLAHLLATARRDTARAIYMLQRIECSPHHVVRIRGADRFRDDILNAQRLKHGAHWTTCDNTRSGRCCPQEHFARAMVAVDVMMERAPFAQRNADQTAFRRISRLLNGVRHFACLTMTEANAPFLIADDDKSSKPKASAAFHHLGNTVDVNELVHEFAIAIVTVPFPASAMWFSRHQRTLSFVSSPEPEPSLKVQT